MIADYEVRLPVSAPSFGLALQAVIGTVAGAGRSPDWKSASPPGRISSVAAWASARMRPDHSGAVQALLGDAQQRVGQCDGHEHAGVEHCGIARHDYEASSGRAARLRAFFRAAA